MRLLSAYAINNRTLPFINPPPPHHSNDPLAILFHLRLSSYVCLHLNRYTHSLFRARFKNWLKSAMSWMLFLQSGPVSLPLFMHNVTKARLIWSAENNIWRHSIGVIQWVIIIQRCPYMKYIVIDILPNGCEYA